MTPADLRALAARVLAEEPSRELRDAVLIEMGWITDGKDYWRRRGSLTWQRFPPPNPLTSHDAAFAAMPAGWRIWEIDQTDAGFSVRFYHVDRGWPTSMPQRCPSLPRALTAAGLVCRTTQPTPPDYWDFATGDDMTPKEILIAARAKIEAPERWTQGAFAKTAKRNKAHANRPRATCWCILGAVAAVTGENPNRPDRAISSGLAAAAGVDAYNECLIEWNDAPERTHAEVLAAFDRAIEAAE